MGTVSKITRKKFLVTGICQGFEVLSTLAAEDKPDLLKVLTRDDIQRPVTWRWNSTDDIRHESRIFGEFDSALIKSMA